MEGNHKYMRTAVFKEEHERLTKENLRLDREVKRLEGVIDTLKELTGFEIEDYIAFLTIEKARRDRV